MMQREEWNRVLQNVKRICRKVLALGLAGCLLAGGTAIVKAATLKDVFDAKGYADANEDVKAAFGYDEEALWNHYVTYGLKEKRPSGSMIDIVKYRETYGDLDAAFGDDWDAYVEHYLDYGISEGRDNFTGTDPAEIQKKFAPKKAARKDVSLKEVFDAKAYADLNPDVKAAFGYDEEALWKHYMTYGIKEGRETGGILNVAKYREANPDLEAAFGDDWDAYVNHYLTLGIEEGRDNFTDFDAKAYADNYKDLKDAYGYDALALYKHYSEMGQAEGRNAETSIQSSVQPAAQPAAPQTPSASGLVFEGAVRSEIVYVYEDGSYYEEYYDSNDNVVGFIYYLADGSIYSWSQYVLDEYGRNIKQTVRRYDNTVISDLTWEYHEDGSYTCYSTIQLDIGLRTTITEYNAEGDEVSSVSYDADGSWRESKHNGNTVETKTYDGDGNLVFWYVEENSEDGKGSKTTYYHEDGSVEEVIIIENHSEGGYKMTCYDPSGRLTAEYEHDSNYNMTWSVFYLENGAYEINRYSYDESGTRLGRTNEYHSTDGTYSISEYDANENLLSLSCYDASGSLVYTENASEGGSDVSGGDIGDVYDENGNLIRYTMCDVNGNPVGWREREYDADGNLRKEVGYYSSDGSVSDYGEYDSRGNLIICLLYDGETDEIIGWIESVYDDANNLVKENTYNLDKELLSYVVYEYDSDGNMVNSTVYDANGNQL